MPYESTRKVHESQRTEADEVKEISVPFVPRNVDLNDLDDNGSLFTDKDLEYLDKLKIKAHEKNIIFGKNNISREQASRRPAVINKELFAIYSGKNHYLGRGAFGKAVLAQKQPSETGEEPEWTVLKVLSAKKNPLPLVTSEIKALSEASNSFIGHCEKQGGAGAKKHYIMMKLARGKPLSKLVEGDAKINFSPIRRMDIAIQLVSSIDAVNKKGYLHRDIKPGNFNYDPSTNRVIILDFGLARKKDETGKVKFVGKDFAPGTMTFMAKEINLPNQFESEEVQQKNECLYNDATDIYALGITLKILFGYQYNNWGLIGDKPAFLEENEEIDQFLNRMDHEDPEKRPLFSEIDEFLKDQLKKLIPKHEESVGILNLSEYENSSTEKRAELRAALKDMHEVALIDTNTETHAGSLDRRRISLIRELEDANIIVNPKIKLSNNPENSIQEIQKYYEELKASGGKIVNIISLVKMNTGLENESQPGLPLDAKSSTASMLMTVGGSAAPSSEKAREMYKVPIYTVPSVEPPINDQVYQVTNPQEQTATPAIRVGGSKL